MRFVNRVRFLDLMSRLLLAFFLFVFLLRKKLDARLELKRLYVTSFDFRAGIVREQLGSPNVPIAKLFVLDI